MWLADTSNSTAITVAVVGGVVTVLAAVFTGLFAFRGSARNTDADREKEFDARVDAEMATLRAENAAIRAENDQLRHKIDRARYHLVVRQIDPSILD